MPVCIYCRKWKKTEEFNTREHVIPQQLGKFENNLILNDALKKIKYVCNNCNKHFGDTIEQWFSIDSLEGYILRAKYLKKEHKKNTKRFRLEMTIKEGDYKGVHVELTENNKIKVLPQIGLRGKDGNWDYFLINQINTIKKEKYDLVENSLRSFGIEEEKAALYFNKIGINFEIKGFFSPPDLVTCDITVRIDKAIKRVVAKIAFNFFAYYNYKKFILDKSFDQIRNFILNNEDMINVQVSNKPILYDEVKNGMAKLGHIITFHKNKSRYIIAQVSLFNHLNYEFKLSETPFDLDIKANGKFFDLGSRKILDMGKTIIHLIPPIIIPEFKLWLPK